MISAEPSDTIFISQVVLAIVVALVYLVRSICIGGKIGISRIIAVAAAASIVPLACVVIYSGAYDPYALDWLKDEKYQLFFLVIGIGVLVVAVQSLQDNWPN